MPVTLYWRYCREVILLSFCAYSELLFFNLTLVIGNKRQYLFVSGNMRNIEASHLCRFEHLLSDVSIIHTRLLCLCGIDNHASCNSGQVF